MTPDDLTDALERDEVEPLFQPQFDATTLDLAGVEALARWRHPDDGSLIQPAFHGLAARKTAELDRQIFEKAVRACARLDRDGVPIPALSVNVSAARLNIMDPAEVQRTARAFRGQVVFELLETICLETEPGITDRIAALRAQGFEIEADDFGSGRTSIIGLMRARPDRLKIDRRLVHPIAGSESGLRIVKAIVEIARALGIGVVAEGVETAEQAMLLRQLGCDRLQGNFFAAPLDAQALADFIATEGWREVLPA